MPEISVIVPCYKAEKTLAKCVNSLTSQTFRDIEIILVNDCSPDSTGELCDSLCKNDSRIKVIHMPKNSGPSAARNAGLDAAQSPWVTFVDSDDWIEPETYAAALEQAVEHNAELVIWSYCSEYGNNKKVKHIYDSSRVFKNSESEQLFTDILGPTKERLSNPELIHSLSPVWNKLMRLDNIRKSNIRFLDLDKIGPEDLFFSAQYAKACLGKTAVYIDKCLYHYVKSDGNSVSTAYNPIYSKTLEFSNSALTSLIENLPGKKNFQTAIRNRQAFSLINIGLNEINCPEGTSVILKKLKNIIRNDKYHYSFTQLETAFLPLKWKIFFLCASLKFTLPIFLMFKFMASIIAEKD